MLSAHFPPYESPRRNVRRPHRSVVLCVECLYVCATALAKGLFIGFTHKHTHTHTHTCPCARASDDEKDDKATIGGWSAAEGRAKTATSILYRYGRACIYIVVHDTRCPGADHLFLYIYFFPYTCRCFSLFIFFPLCTGIIIARVRVFFTL